MKTSVTAYIADRYSNPIPAGNPVYFASACGTMALTDINGVSTNLTNQFGQATATSITGNPIEREGECRMLIWTEGEEAWVDTNANGFYDAGEPHQGIGEPYIDSNNNDRYDVATETYFDLDGNGRYTRLTTPGTPTPSSGLMVLCGGRTNTAFTEFSPQTFSLNFGESQTFNFTAADINGNPLPAGTTIKVSTSCDAELTGEKDVTLPDAVYAGPHTTEFSVTLTSEYTGGNTWLEPVLHPDCRCLSSR